MKPTNSTIMSLLSVEDARQVEEVWKDKFRLIYKQNVFNMKDNNISEEIEKEEFKRQSFRFK